MRANAPRTTSVEDYVKAIYKTQEWHRQAVTTSSLAAWFGVSAPSVSDMVRKLARRGLVDHTPYKPIALTPAGRRLAMRMVRRHRLIETYLVRELGYTWDEVHDEAEVLEHAVSDTFLDRIAQLLGEPAHDPHGDPIPTSSGDVDLPEAVPLSGLGPGGRGRVVRVSDADPEVLRSLSAYGIGPGTRVRVTERAAGALRVAVEPDAGGGSGGPRRALEHQITAAQAAALWVEISPASGPK